MERRFVLDCAASCGDVRCVAGGSGATPAAPRLEVCSAFSVRSCSAFKREQGVLYENEGSLRKYCVGKLSQVEKNSDGVLLCVSYNLFACLLTKVKIGIDTN